LKELFLYQEPLLNYNLEKGEAKVNIIGTPFDVTTTYRPGSRFGPNAIREAFAHIEIYYPEEDIDLEKFTMRDLGNLRASKKVEDYLLVLEKVLREIKQKTFCILGGEHTVSLGSIRALKEDKVCYVIFDAHFDLRDEFEGLKVNHATYLRRGIEELDKDRFFHIGVRAVSKEEWDYAKKIGLKFLTSKEVKNSPNKVKEILNSFEKFYISLDLDILDPSYAPGVSNPEPFGLSSQELRDILRIFKGKKLVGFDLVEVSPPYDNGNTALLAAKLLAEFLYLVY